MRNLGNSITLHSPSRWILLGFGSTVTVIFINCLALHIATIQYICVATVDIGL